MRRRAWLPALAILFVAGCGDKTIALTYSSCSGSSPIPTSPRA
jgi:hypothetical protein